MPGCEVSWPDTEDVCVGHDSAPSLTDSLSDSDATADCHPATLPAVSSTLRLLRVGERVHPAKKGKDRPHSITERRVPELMPVLGSQPANDESHKPGGRLPLLSTRPAVTPATLKRAASNFAAW